MAIFSLGSTLVSTVLVITQLIRQYDGTPVPESEVNFEGFFLSFGTILISFGGATCFPSIHNDMKEKKKFPLAITCGLLGKKTKVKCLLLLKLKSLRH